MYVWVVFEVVVFFENLKMLLGIDVLKCWGCGKFLFCYFGKGFRDLGILVGKRV